MAKNCMLQDQLAHLINRTNEVRRLPLWARANMINELLELQLALFGAIVDDLGGLHEVVTADNARINHLVKEITV